MLERIRTGIKKGVREFLDQNEVPFLHKHTTQCIERRRIFFLGLYNRPGDVERVQKKFEGSEQVEVDGAKGSIWGKRIRGFNMVFLDIPNNNFVPSHLEREFIYDTKHVGSLWADIVFADDGLDHIFPQVRRHHDIVTMERPGYIHISINGISEGPEIRDLEAFRGATIYLERKSKKRKYDDHKWTLNISSVVDISP